MELEFQLLIKNNWLLEEVQAKFKILKIWKYHMNIIKFVLTHGFRGEALNSIATLSNVTIISKHKDEELGWKWEIPQEPTKIAR